MHLQNTAIHTYIHTYIHILGGEFAFVAFGIAERMNLISPMLAKLLLTTVIVMSCMYVQCMYVCIYVLHLCSRMVQIKDVQ